MVTKEDTKSLANAWVDVRNKPCEHQIDRSVVRVIQAGTPRGAVAGLRRAARPCDELVPADALADAPPPLPELAEPDLVRHFANLSTLNMSVDTHFYPLGSCTMKYNPKRNERLASLPGMADLHPYQPEETLQGLLELLFECSRCWARSRDCRPCRSNRRPGPTGSSRR